MKLPKTGPGRQDVHGELLVRILGPSIRGPAHANDLGIPVSLEPLRTTGQPSNDQQSTTIYEEHTIRKFLILLFFFLILFFFLCVVNNFSLSFLSLFLAHFHTCAFVS